MKLTDGQGPKQSLQNMQCVGCGLCAARCDPGALYMENGKVHIHEDDCIFCKDCFGPCPSVDFIRDNDGEFEQ